MEPLDNTAFYRLCTWLAEGGVTTHPHQPLKKLFVVRLRLRFVTVCGNILADRNKSTYRTSYELFPKRQMEVVPVLRESLLALFPIVEISFAVFYY